ncbi:MAG: hypothetical protein ACI9AF_001302, partial [Granulosicoccus sp.]
RKRVRVSPNGSVSEGFARRLGEAEKESRYWSEGWEFFKEWFRIDPDAAIEAMRTSPKGGSVSYFLCFLFEEESDPLALQAMGARLDDIIFSAGNWHEQGFSGEVHRVFDFAVGKSLVEKVEGLPESYMKKDLWRYAMAGWLFQDWKGAAEWAGSLTGEERREAEVAFFSERIPRSMERDGEALEWASKVLAREGNRDLLVKLGPDFVGLMARDDPGEAVSWAGDHLGGMALAKAVSGVVSTTYRGAPEESEAMVDGLPPGGVRQAAARAFVEVQLRADAKGAYERAISEEALGMRLGVQTWLSIGRSLGQQNPGEVRAILGSGEGELESVFETYAMEQAFWKEPEEAKRWAEEMEGEKRDEMIELVYRAWGAREKDEARAWRDGLEK